MSTAVATTSPASTFASLRIRLKQLQVETNHVYQNWQIRVHRSLSWLKRSEELLDDQPDFKFMLLWIALNSLYSRWGSERSAPAHEAASRANLAFNRYSWMQMHDVTVNSTPKFAPPLPSCRRRPSNRGRGT